jgi:histidinol-phosphatase (PHP family)
VVHGPHAPIDGLGTDAGLGVHDEPGPPLNRPFTAKEIQSLGDSFVLPADNHVHTEWSWEATGGSMEKSCARAVELGVPSIAFTEHGDLTRWAVAPEFLPRLPECFRARVGPAGVLVPPDLEVAGYLEAVRRCRGLFPELRILTGIELSEPHWHADRVAALLSGGRFDRVLGSVHSISTSAGHLMVDDRYRTRSADAVGREYLAEVLRMIETCDAFQVLAHVDYFVRSWPPDAEPYRPELFEEEFRAVLRALARTGRALEVNMKVPLHGAVVSWWHEAGGEAISFGSDAHAPERIAHGFADAAALAAAHGFRPGPEPMGFWTRN